MLVWDPEGLIHRRTLQGSVLVDLAFLHDQVIKILLDDDTIDCHVVAQVFLLCCCGCACANDLSIVHGHIFTDSKRPLNACVAFTRHQSLLEDFLGEIANNLR